MSYTNIINLDETFSQGNTLEDLLCYVSTQLGKCGWTFHYSEDEVFSWFKEDLHLRVNFSNKTTSVTNIETLDKRILRDIPNWKMFVYELENELK